MMYDYEIMDCYADVLIFWKDYKNDSLITQNYYFYEFKRYGISIKATNLASVRLSTFVLKGNPVWNHSLLYPCLCFHLLLCLIV